MRLERKIAPASEWIRYLTIFRRAFAAMRDYSEQRDREGMVLGLWIADALHHVSSMLCHYDPVSWHTPEEIGNWMRTFPQVVRRYGAPASIITDCDYIFSPENALAELKLKEDLSDLNLAPDETLERYLDLFYQACLWIRLRPASLQPWSKLEQIWTEEKETLALAGGRLCSTLYPVPEGLVHWNEFDEQGFLVKARAEGIPFESHQP